MKFEDMLNTITLGDSYKLIKDIPDKSIDCIYTDIPYLITHGGKGNSPLARRIDKVHNTYLKDIKDGIDYKILEEFIRISKKINCFIWCSKEQIYEILKFFKEKGYMFEILVWTKTNPTPATNNVWLPDIEYCLYFRESGVQHTTQKDDIVLDCFSGSGTTCVAAKELNRQFIGIEIDPKYHKISLDRLNGILANGQISFDTDINKI